MCSCDLNMKRFALMSVAGFIFIFLSDWVIHGMLLMDMYEQTPQLWRVPEDMEVYFPWMTVNQILLTLVLAFIFTRNFEGKGMMEGVRFGVMFGLLTGLGAFGSYAYMPISLTLAFAWLGSMLVQVTGLGVIFALLYKNKEGA